MRRLAVWGDPIAHSKSPILHGAAYSHLGLDWVYDRRRVDEVGFTAALAGLGADWLGLSVTMPLKGAAHRAAQTLDRHATLTGAVNTLLLTDGGPHGFNTDVGGIVDALTGQEVTGIGSVRILGAGATAASALTAAAELGATTAEVRARRPERAAHLLSLGERLSVEVTAMPLSPVVDTVDATLATLPSGTTLEHGVAGSLAEHGGVLFDAAYAPWPSDLAAGWPQDAPVISGLEMLLHQAVRQVRVFRHGDPDAELPGEREIIESMRAALLPA